MPVEAMTTKPACVIYFRSEKSAATQIGHLRMWNRICPPFNSSQKITWLAVDVQLIKLTGGKFYFGKTRRFFFNISLFSISSINRGRVLHALSMNTGNLL